jgi:Tfp pilus assembly protein PilP
MTELTNPVTAKLATIIAALNLRRRNLIGIVGGADMRRALIRHADGAVQTLRVGDALDGGTITAISDSEVMINTRRGPARIGLPEPKTPAAAA